MPRPQCYDCDHLQVPICPSPLIPRDCNCRELSLTYIVRSLTVPIFTILAAL